MYFQGNIKKHTEAEIKLFDEYGNFFDTSPIPTISKLQNFPKYIRRQDISRFLAKIELFKLQIHVPGVIVEGGSYLGGGTMTFAQLSSIYEPYNHTRKVISFDTFEGFPRVSKNDNNQETTCKEGSLSTFRGIEEEIQKAIDLFDKNRPLSHIEKVELIKGDACEAIPKYIKENPHIVVSMLYLDVDIYEPTKVALEYFIPRIPRGGIIAFDELNTKNFPGETLAVIEVLGLNRLKLKKTLFDPYISYAIME